MPAINRKQSRTSFVSLSIQVSDTAPRKTHLFPVPSAEAMQLNIECDQCHLKFAVVGCAFFCPFCGHNSILRTFDDALRKIRSKRDNTEIVRHAISEANGKDEAELTCRSMQESCLTDGVTAFQKFCDGLYSTYGQPPFNVFQSLDRGEKLWKNAIGEGYRDWLSEYEYAQLVVLFQKRHLLAHSDGIVDQKYIDHSEDNSYRVGQRIVIRNDDIETLLRHLESMANSLKRHVQT